MTLYDSIMTYNKQNTLETFQLVESKSLLQKILSILIGPTIVNADVEKKDFYLIKQLV